MASWITTLLPKDLQLASFEGQIMIDLEVIVKKYSSVPNYVWKNALKETLQNTNNIKTRRGFNYKWAQFVKDNYAQTKKEMGGDIKRIDVLMRLSELYKEINQVP